jgi:membrane-bound metal-dependent hydrolase YbcI (DUF457 family)
MVGMMGKHHAMSGAAAWVALTSTTPYALHWHPLPTASVAVGALVTAGSALLLDIDHHSSTAARTAGPISEAVASGVQAVAGHRGATHSLLAVAGLTGATIAAGHWYATLPLVGRIPIGSLLVFTTLLAMASKGLKLARGGLIGLWAGALTATAAVLYLAPEQMEWLPLSVLVGAIVHLIGDAMTTDGIPLLWPFKPKPPKKFEDVPVVSAVWKSNGNFSVPVLGNSGSQVEWVLFVGLTTYTLFVLGATTVSDGAHL